ncbi:MAG: PRC-barrel domain protein [Methanobacterium sp. PtaU1.Bin242]|nr:MAG: PRC-barrel domain protein [Methanobacterium sp. PtaU1.Bin242]
MKASEFIGMSVLDKGAHEVGKVAEISLKLKTCMVDKIFISTGGALNKKYFAISGDELSGIGDFVQLKLDKEGVTQKVHLDKLKDFMPQGFHFKDFVGKTVLTQNGLEIGKISDMLIDPKGCLIHNVIINTGNTFNKKNLVISDENINAIGDYVILNLTKEEVEDMID